MEETGAVTTSCRNITKNVKPIVLGHLDGQLKSAWSGQCFRFFHSDNITQYYPNYVKKHNSERSSYKGKKEPLPLQDYISDGLRNHDTLRQYINTNDPKMMAYYMTETNFGGRIYHPIVNMNKVVRRHKGAITIEGENVCECDLKCSQVEFFNHMMNNLVKGNDFSQWFESVDDPYVEVIKLFPNENLIDRDSGKTFMFRLMYGKVPPISAQNKDAFAHQKFCNQWQIAGETLTGIKMIDVDGNPKTMDNQWQKKYTNSPFLMTIYETETFGVIWQELHHKDIPFVTLHDGIMCKESDAVLVKSVMEETLKTVIRPEIEVKIQ